MFIILVHYPASPVREKPERPPIGTKIITSTKSPNNSYRKDSFGSKDSLNDSNNLQPSLFGNVAAHRRSLESKNLEPVEKPPRKSIIMDSKTSSDIRKSLESLDEKTKPPPVLGKKPTVPIKKSPSVSTVAGSIFSGLKSKVKSVESKLHAHDSMDGTGSSRLSQVADSNEKNVIGERMKKDDSEFDHVERGSFLQDMRQNRAKAPKRRPPTSAGSIGSIGDSNNNLNMNGSHLETSQDSFEQSNDSQLQHSDDEVLAKPKAREWEKHKAPWMAELKANQAKKTSPVVEPRSSPDSNDEKHDMSKSFSSSFAASQTINKTKSADNSFEIRASSMEVKSNSFDVFKKEKQEVINNNNNNIISNSSSHSSTQETTTQAQKQAVSSTKISITENSSSVMTTTTNNTQEVMTTTTPVSPNIPKIRPTSVNLRNRSISPISRTSLNTKSMNMSELSGNHITKPLPIPVPIAAVAAAVAATVTATTISSSTSGGDVVSSRVNELEQRVNKLESLVTVQHVTIEDLRKQLRDESEKVKTLKSELEKYAQCFTQV